MRKFFLWIYLVIRWKLARGPNLKVTNLELAIEILKKTFPNFEINSISYGFGVKKGNWIDIEVSVGWKMKFGRTMVIFYGPKNQSYKIYPGWVYSEELPENFP